MTVADISTGLRWILVRAFSLLLVLFLFSGSLFAQNTPLFSQYMFNGLAVNPAYSSVDEAFSVSALSRHQWVGFKGSPNTQTLAMHSHVGESNTSLGFMLMRDQIGEVINETGAYLSASQRVEVGEDNYLAVALNGGIARRSANYSEIDAGSRYDPAFPNQNEWDGNLGFGLMYFSKQFYLGFSSPFFYYRPFHDNSSGQQEVVRPTYLLQGGYLLDFGEDFKLKPNLLVKYVNGSPMQIDVNANLLIKETLWIGVSWRSFDSVDLLAQIQLTPKVQVGYAYDYTTSGLANVQRGSHEIMLNFRLPVKGRSFPRCYF